MVAQLTCLIYALALAGPEVDISFSAASAAAPPPKGGPAERATDARRGEAGSGLSSVVADDCYTLKVKAPKKVIAGKDFKVTVTLAPSPPADYKIAVKAGFYFKLEKSEGFAAKKQKVGSSGAKVFTERKVVASLVLKARVAGKLAIEGLLHFSVCSQGRGRREGCRSFYEDLKFEVEVASGR